MDKDYSEVSGWKFAFLKWWETELEVSFFNLTADYESLGVAIRYNDLYYQLFLRFRRSHFE